MATGILLFTAVVLAGLITLFLGALFLKHEDLWVSMVGLLVAMCSTALTVRGADGNTMLAITYVQYIASAVGGAMLLMVILAWLVNWRRRVKARKAPRATVSHEVSLPRPRVQYYEKRDHPPWNPPRGSDHPKT